MIFVSYHQYSLISYCLPHITEMHITMSKTTNKILIALISLNSKNSILFNIIYNKTNDTISIQ